MNFPPCGCEFESRTLTSLFSRSNTLLVRTIILQKDGDMTGTLLGSTINRAISRADAFVPYSYLFAVDAIEVSMTAEISSFGRWLQRRRKALDLTQEELAQRVACAAETIRKIEADVRRPSRQIAER